MNALALKLLWKISGLTYEEQNDFISYLRNTDLSKLNFPKSDLYDRKSVLKINFCVMEKIIYKKTASKNCSRPVLKQAILEGQKY